MLWLARMLLVQISTHLQSAVDFSFCKFSLNATKPFNLPRLVGILLVFIDLPKDNGGAAINTYVVEMSEGVNGKYREHMLAFSCVLFSARVHQWEE